MANCVIRQMSVWSVPNKQCIDTECRVPKLGSHPSYNTGGVSGTKSKV